VRRSPLYLVLDLETLTDPELKDQETDKQNKPRFPSPPCHQIICAGYAFLEDHRVKDWDVLTDSEPEILDKLTSTIREQRPILVTMNGRGFDLPVIASRCVRHAIPHPWYYGSKNARYRYAQTHHLDLQDYLCDHGASPRASLDVWARLIGWPGKQGESGAQIPEMLERGGIQLVAHYCLSDIVQTTAVLLRTDLVRGVLDEPEYQGAAEDLLETCEKDERTAGLAAKVDRKRFLLPEPWDQEEVRQ